MNSAIEHLKLNPLREILATEHQSAIELAFLDATNHGQQKILQLFLAKNANTQCSVNAAFFDAAYYNQKNIIEFFLMQKNKAILPDQKGVNWAFGIAARKGHKEIVKLLQTEHKEVPLPDQDAVNFALSGAANSYNVEIVKLLLTKCNNIPLPDHDGINWAFSNAAIRIDVTEEILKKSYTVPLVDQYRINMLFKDGIKLILNPGKHDNPEYVVDWLLKQPYGLPLPDKNTIIKAYRDVVTCNKIEAIALLSPLVPENIKNEQPLTNSKDIILKHKNTESDKSTLNTVFHTNEAISAHIQKRIESSKKTNKTYTWDQIINKMNVWIDRNYTNTIYYVSSRQAIQRDWPYNTKQLLHFIMTFLDLNKSYYFDHWIKIFLIYTSHRADINETDFESLILKSLIGVDSELDQLFSIPYRDQTIRFFFESFNFSQISGVRFIAKRLKNEGVTSLSTVENTMNVLKKYIEKEINSHKLKVNDYQNQIKEILDLGHTYYDEKIIPEIKTLEDNMKKYDHFSETERLSQLLIKDKAKEHADLLADAMYGSTGTEICTALKWHIRNILNLDFISNESRSCAERLWIELDRALRRCD